VLRATSPGRFVLHALSRKVSSDRYCLSDPSGSRILFRRLPPLLSPVDRRKMTLARS
jgi:hypothetical protein